MPKRKRRKLPVSQTKSKQNYGVLTDISKEFNTFFGDRTGSSVSRRTAHGLKRGLDLRNVDDNSAEFIVHAGMVATGALLKSKDETSKGIGIFLGAALWACYLNGEG